MTKLMLKKSLVFFFLSVICNIHLLAVETKFLIMRRMESLDPIATYAQGLSADDFSIVTRLTKAYPRAVDAQQALGNSQWQHIFNTFHADIHSIFMMGHFESIAPILRNPGATNLFFGIDGLAQCSLAMLTQQTVAYEHAAKCLDCLVRFAEAIGAIPTDNPEYYDHNPMPVPWQADDVVKRIELVLGQTISFPNPYPNEHGILTCRGVASYRAMQALYQAWRIKELLKNIPQPRVLEIGAGVGRTAYYAKLFGIEDYTIVDLPIISMVSGYFLARVLGEDQILLLGETASNSKQRIKYLSPADFLASSDSYDLIINADSLTEMDPNVARAYWNRIASNTKIFLSINHEANSFTVKELIDKTTPVDRFPYWMRRGYVEEVVRFVAKK